jgi:wobble nucleotide-excising tRNase
MLKRISNIQGIGLLHQASGKSHSCEKATLIYADNGRGKSTLASVLRSVSTGDASLVIHRKTVDGTLPPKVALQFNSGHTVSFDSGAWSEQRPEVLVFDADFIENNVHSGGSVNTGHRKNLLEFALGEAAVAARIALEKATGEAKAATDEVQKLSLKLSGHHVGISLSQFEKLTPVLDADAQLAALQKRISAAGNVAAILAKPVPSNINEPSFDLVGLFSELGTSLDDVHANAEQIVKNHVAKLESKTAESWLSQGQQFNNTDACPYCAQNISDNDLIRAYQTHFNAAYNTLKAKVAALHNKVATGFDPNIVEGFAKSTTTAAAQAEAWSEYVTTKPITFDADSSRSALTELQTFLLDLCQKKRVSPAEPLGSDKELERAKALWLHTLAPMQAANGAIKSAGVLITSYKEQLKTENVQQLQQQVQAIQARKRRHDTVVVGLFSELGNASKLSKNADTAKKTARDTLDSIMRTTLSQYEGAINTLLGNFGASFRIKGMGGNFRGTAPRSEYGLVLRGKDVTLEGGSPSFATALSEGDKRTLAFSFFIARTLADPKLATRIVVIDDPMCSLDINRKHQTKLVLKKLHSTAEQLIVLAHDLYFIRDIRDALHKENKTTPIAVFQLAHAPGDYTSFASLDVDKECESAYFLHHRLLNDFATGKGGDTKSVAKAIRPMLEGYLHRRFPGIVSKSMLFGEIVVLIRNSSPTSPLCHAQNLVEKLNTINDYAGKFHHDTNPSIVASELKTIVELALSVVHQGA